mmetsp:Transcript_60889/g.163011  ORF Transcript_60889/g.163011 Transcript_60889/m.163011 type:complete len:278 (+) Transcript_60889:153-986(+)
MQVVPVEEVLKGWHHPQVLPPDRRSLCKPLPKDLVAPVRAPSVSDGRANAIVPSLVEVSRVLHRLHKVVVRAGARTREPMLRQRLPPDELAKLPLLKEGCQVPVQHANVLLGSIRTDALVEDQVGGAAEERLHRQLGARRQVWGRPDEVDAERRALRVQPHALRRRKLHLSRGDRFAIVFLGGHVQVKGVLCTGLVQARVVSGPIGGLTCAKHAPRQLPETQGESSANRSCPTVGRDGVTHERQGARGLPDHPLQHGLQAGERMGVAAGAARHERLA